MDASEQICSRCEKFFTAYDCYCSNCLKELTSDVQDIADERDAAIESLEKAAAQHLLNLSRIVALRDALRELTIAADPRSNMSDIVLLDALGVAHVALDACAGDRR